MHIRTTIAALAALALVAAQQPAEARGAGGAIAGGIIGGIALGALAASAANANRVYPPPPPRYYGGPGDAYGTGYQPSYGLLYSETENQAIEACRRGLLIVARKNGATGARLNDVEFIDPTADGGHRLQVEITMFYPRSQREAEVVCNTRNGVLLGARAIN